MVNRSALIFVLTLPAVLNLPIIRIVIKRSPLDFRTPFDSSPRLYIPPGDHHNTPIALAPVLTPNHVPRLQLKESYHDKGPNVEHVALQQLLSPLYPQAVSKTHKTSVHTDVKHVITQDNIKIPVLTHTISHTASNITHPFKAVLFTVHVAQEASGPLVLQQDTSVIPLHHSSHLQDPGDHLQNLVAVKRQERKRSETITADSSDDSQDGRNPVGGFGTGLTFGGHGAGHGFFAYG